MSVVIPTHRRPELLQRCLAAVGRDPAAAEIVVVHDEDDAATVAVLARHAGVRPVPAPAAGDGAERGQAARDAGVRAATGDVVLALDDDVIAHPGLVTGHARRHAARPGLVVVGYMPVVLPPRGVPGRAAAMLYAAGYERQVEGYRRSPGSVLENVWGGNLSAPRDAWLAAITSPAVHGGYHGDLAFALRLRELGLAGCFDPALRADHWYRRTLEQIAADAQSSALGRARIEAAHPGSQGDRTGSARPALRPLVAAGAGLVRGDAAAERALAALSAAARAAARHRLHRSEMLLTRMAWRLAFERARTR